MKVQQNNQLQYTLMEQSFNKFCQSWYNKTNEAQVLLMSIVYRSNFTTVQCSTTVKNAHIIGHGQSLLIIVMHKHKLQHSLIAQILSYHIVSMVY